MNLNMKIARMKNGITQYDLSYSTRIPQGTISLIEQGIKQPSFDQAQKIAEALHMSIEEIFPKIRPNNKR